MSQRALAFLAACLLAATTASAEEITDGIAAQVGSDIVLYSEVIEVVAPRETRAREAGLSESEIVKIRADALEQIIEWRLLEQVVAQTELYATDEDIDRAIENIATENGISVGELQKSVVAQGLPYDQYRTQLKREIERQKVMAAMIMSKVRVEEPDIESLYRERFADQPDGGVTYHVRQILVTPNGKDPAETCTAVREAHVRIEGGEAFEAVARDVSEVAPARGGDIGWLHKDSLASWMSTVLDGLDEGQTSGVIELPFGCGLLKLVERREFTPITFEQAKPALEQELFETKASEQFAEWLEKLRAKTYIERRGYFADAARLRSSLDDEDEERMQRILEDEEQIEEERRKKAQQEELPYLP